LVPREFQALQSIWAAVIRPLLLAASSTTLLAPMVLGQTTEPASGDPTPAIALTRAGLVSIESDVQKADNLTGIITASGNVRIVYPDRRVVATARQAQYFSREARIVLSGDVDVIQSDGNALRAQRVTVLIDRQRVVAEPISGQQVLSTLRIDGTP
jgi:lipopolysaccharide export system protein LptA